METGSNIFDYESEIEHRSGRKIPVKLNATVLRDNQQKPIGGVVSFRDLSHLEELEKSLRSESNFHGMIGTHKSIQEIITLIQDVSDSNSNVFITGESGTGKELVANAIQATSVRKDKPFIKINCSVFPPHLLASELFGHVKGSFTDAVKDRVGRFEMADGGTIFLDEVAEMPLAMQVQLLRVLQEGTFERIGESITRTTNVRVLAATNKDIETELAEGRFREDLFYRLNVIPILVPPLRERRSDIPKLVHFFIEKFSLISGKKIYETDDEAMDLLISYDWPGNIRELENAVEYAFARTRDDILHASKLPPAVRLNADCGRKTKYIPEDIISGDEKDKIKRVLDKNQWNRSNAARELGMGRTTLWRKMRALGLV